MNGYLLETNATLQADVRTALRNGPNHISVVTCWEVALKSMKGMLKVGRQ